MLRDNYTTVAIDQTRKSVGWDLYRAWLLEGKRIPLPYRSESTTIKLFRAVSDDGETFFSEVNGRSTSDVTMHFLRVLQDELGDRLHIVLDNAAHFAWNQAIGFNENSKLKVTYLPAIVSDQTPKKSAGGGSSDSSATASSSQSTSCGAT